MVVGGIDGVRYAPASLALNATIASERTGA